MLGNDTKEHPSSSLGDPLRKNPQWSTREGFAQNHAKQRAVYMNDPEMMHVFMCLFFWNQYPTSIRYINPFAEAVFRSGPLLGEMKSVD